MTRSIALSIAAFVTTAVILVGQGAAMGVSLFG